MNFRVLSYNIHKGFSFFGQELVLPKIKTSIDLVSADILFLQEVVGENVIHEVDHDDWPDRPQFEFLADQVWSHYSYGKNAVYDSGHHGNAILSRFPIISWSNTNISTNRLEQRGFLHSQVLLPDTDQTVELVCLHLDLLESGRLRQVQQLTRFLDQLPKDAPVVVAGDFNDWTGRCGREMESHGYRDAFTETVGRPPATFPAQWPILRLDRIFVRGLKVLETRVLSGDPWTGLSDHLGIEATLQLSSTF